jgi:hypothetical protein
MMVSRVLLYRRARIRIEALSKLSRVIVWHNPSLARTPEMEQTGPTKPHVLQAIRKTVLDNAATKRFPYLFVSKELHFGQRIALFLWHKNVYKKLLTLVLYINCSI